MMLQSGRAPRRGLATVVVLICLVVIMLISGVLLKIGVAHRDRVRSPGAEPTSRVAGAGRAGSCTGSTCLDAGYAGETWVFAPRDLGLAEAPGGESAKAALVLIKIEKPPGAPELRLIKVQADFPPDPPHRARHSAQMLVELGSLKTGGSR